MKESQRALELLRRVRLANAERAEKAPESERGNRYVLPEPLAVALK